MYNRARKFMCAKQTIYAIRIMKYAKKNICCFKNKLKLKYIVYKITIKNKNDINKLEI